MSTMRDLYLKVAADAVLQEKVNKIFEANAEDGAAAAAKLVEFAKEQGYDVTVEEIREFFKSLSEKSNEALDDEDLEAVAGGKYMGGNGGSRPTISMGGALFMGCGGPVTSIVPCGGFLF